MEKLLKNISLLAACAASLTISGCAASNQGATAGQGQSLNSTGAGAAGTGAGVGGVGNAGIGSGNIGGSGAGGIGSGGAQGPGGGR